MKIITTISFFSVMLLASCSGDSNIDHDVVAEVGADAIEEMIEVEEPEEIIELTEEEIELNKRRLNDSLGAEFKELTTLYDNLKQRFENEKEGFFTFSHRTFDDFSGETQTWYFSPSFELQFYYRDLGVEGGYEETELRYFENEQLGFARSTKSEMDNPIIQFENYLDEDWEVKALAYNPTAGENENYFYPSVPDRINDYERFISEISKDMYTFSDKFNFDDSKMVRSEYGGEVSEGYSINIDSLLFIYLYSD